MPELPPDLPRTHYRTPCADKNDRLGWKAGFTVKLDGLLFGVRTNSAELLPRLRAVFPSNAVEDSSREVDILLSFMEGGETGRKGVRNYHIVYDAWDRVARTMDLDAALGAFASTMVEKVLKLSREKLYLDAAVVAWQEQAILVVGGLEERKRAVEALLAQGAEPHCHQAVLDAEQRLESCGGSGRRALTPALALFVARSGAEKTRRVRLTPAKTALELYLRAFSGAFQPHKTMAELATLAQSVVAYRLPPSPKLSRLLPRER